MSTFAFLLIAVDLLSFGAVPNDGTDQTAAFEKAIATGEAVDIPVGTFHINLDTANNFTLCGAGSLHTILKPFDKTKAIITYRQPTSWSYHSTITGVQFCGSEDKQGVGFTYARTKPGDYQQWDEFAGNCTFRNCKFARLAKGFQSPFGNIGTSFYDCGFQANKYGVYLLDAKFGGSMHAGNKYFYGGEFSQNDVALYADGHIGRVSLTNTIIEANSIGVYIKGQGELQCSGLWHESNGQDPTATQKLISIDEWNGGSVQQKDIDCHAFWLRGDGLRATFDNSVVGDIFCEGSNCVMRLNNCEITKDSQVVDSSSRLTAHDCRGTLPQGLGSLASGTIEFFSDIANTNGWHANARWAFVDTRLHRIDYLPSCVTAETGYTRFEQRAKVVTDGLIYTRCNEFSQQDFEFGQYRRMIPLTIDEDGWHVATFDIRVLEGKPVFYLWDGGQHQWMNQASMPNDKWHTVGTFAYLKAGTQLGFDAAGRGGNARWRVSAFQLHRFESKTEAQSFLASGIYAGK